MPRVGRVVIPGCAHHITQRGNNRQDIFFVDDDRRAYLGILREQAGLHGLRIEGYCLMTNHVHLLATPAAPPSLAKAVGRTHWLYTQQVCTGAAGICGRTASTPAPWTRGTSGRLWPTWSVTPCGPG